MSSHSQPSFIAQADLLESIPFLREITPLDLLNLPKGLFEALPKPCNMKRTASGGPIWPPVLTKVLINGEYNFLQIRTVPEKLDQTSFATDFATVFDILGIFLTFFPHLFRPSNPTPQTTFGRQTGLRRTLQLVGRFHLPSDAWLGSRCSGA